MEDALEREWDAAVDEYVLVVSRRGASQDDVREAWQRAQEVLDRLVDERARKDAEAPVV